MLLSSVIVAQRNEEEGGIFTVMTFVFPSNCYAWWGTANQEGPEHLPASEKQCMNYCLLCWHVQLLFSLFNSRYLSLWVFWLPLYFHPGPQEGKLSAKPGGGLAVGQAQHTSAVEWKPYLSWGAISTWYGLGLPQRESAGCVQKRTGYLGYKQLGEDVILHCWCMLRGHTEWKAWNTPRFHRMQSNALQVIRSEIPMRGVEWYMLHLCLGESCLSVFWVSQSWNHTPTPS